MTAPNSPTPDTRDGSWTDAQIEALRKDAARYRYLQKVTPHRFKKIQDASITDGGDVLYLHVDRFDAAIDTAMQGDKP